MRRREFLTSGLALAGLGLDFLLFGFQTTPPNIVLILADDWGYGAAGCYGNPFIHTPNIDALVSQGLRFTQAYSPSCVCAPTRWAIMTGQHCGWSETAGNNSILYPGQETIANQLKGMGYRTGLIGKWGINNEAGDPAVYPNQAGFDAFFGYRTHFEAWEFFPSQLWENEAQIAIPPGTYAPDLLTAEAIEFMAGSQPFFLYFPVNLPHANGNLTPPESFQVPPGYEPYAGESWTETEKNYAAMHTYLDGIVGQLVAAAPPNTIIIFSSDNGPDDFFPEPLLGTAGGLRGEKTTLYEAGISVPLIVSGPGIAPGVEHNPASLVNFGQVALSGDVSRFIEPGPMYWIFEHHTNGLSEAVRLGDWKGIRGPGGWELYDLGSDPGETTNLAASQPDLIATMEAVVSRYCPSPKTCEIYLPAVGK